MAQENPQKSASPICSKSNFCIKLYETKAPYTNLKQIETPNNMKATNDQTSENNTQPAS